MFRGNNHTSECGNTFIGCHTTTLMLSPRPTKVLVSSLRNIKTILCPWRPDNWVEQPKTRKAKHPTRQIIALFVPSYDNFIPRTYWVNKMSPEALAGLSNGNAPPLGLLLPLQVYQCVPNNRRYREKYTNHVDPNANRSCFADQHYGS